MCSVCGVLGGGPDWIDRVGNPDGVGHHDDLTPAPNGSEEGLWSTYCCGRAG